MGTGEDTVTETQIKEIILERLAVASRRGVARNVLENAEVRVIAANDFADALIMDLRSYVMTERVLEDSADVPFSADVPVEVPPPPDRMAAKAALITLGIVLGFVGAETRSVVVAATGVAITLLGIFVLRERQRPSTAVAHVTGTVKVDATYYRAFPDADIPLPDRLGKPVRMVELASSATDLYGKARKVSCRAIVEKMKSVEWS